MQPFLDRSESSLKRKDEENKEMRWKGENGAGERKGGAQRKDVGRERKNVHLVIQSQHIVCLY